MTYSSLCKITCASIQIVSIFLTSGTGSDFEFLYPSCINFLSIYMEIQSALENNVTYHTISRNVIKINQEKYQLSS